MFAYFFKMFIGCIHVFYFFLAAEALAGGDLRRRCPPLVFEEGLERVFEHRAVEVADDEDQA